MPEKSSIDILKATISNRGGFAKPSKFYAEFSLPTGVGSGAGDMTDLSIMCESSSIPTRSINTVEYSTFRQTYKTPASYSLPDVTCVFLVGNDMFPKNIFDKWMALTVDPLTYRVKYVEDYSSTINIYQLDVAMNRIYGVQLSQAFPILVSPIELDGNNTNTVQKISVTFTYYDLLMLSGADLTNASPDPKTNRFNISGSIGGSLSKTIGGVTVGGAASKDFRRRLGF